MKENDNPIPAGYKLNKATTDGLILSSVTILLSSAGLLLIRSMGKVPVSISVFIWILQISASIYLLYRFMKEYSLKSGLPAFGFGVITCLLSSFLCASYALASYLWLFPEMKEQFSSVFEMMQSKAQSAEQQEMFFKVEDNYAKILFFVTLIKDFIIGLIASAIISSSLKKTDVFETSEE